MKGLTHDTGVLIAFEMRDRRAVTLFREADPGDMKRLRPLFEIKPTLLPL